MKRKEYSELFREAYRYAQKCRWKSRKINGRRGVYCLVLFVAISLAKSQNNDFCLSRTVLSRIAKVSTAAIQKATIALIADGLLEVVSHGEWQGDKPTRFRLLVSSLASA